MNQTMVFYDGECGLCQKSVQWLLNHDSEGRLRFAPLQGSTAADALGERDDLAGVDSIVFLEEGRLYLRSRAVFQIASYLDPGWRWLRHFRILPAFLTDLGYRFIAKIRYRVWGKADVCRVPSLEERARFLP
ncbi:MAG: putative DCC family thiol-disulfide oxidoreductase YuxK [Polyangiales bacterium]|jgi:predicted DCC family thiol-disulfide oxidoreductase YuxK